MPAGREANTKDASDPVHEKRSPGRDQEFQGSVTRPLVERRIGKRRTFLKLAASLGTKVTRRNDRMYQVA